MTALKNLGFSHHGLYYSKKACVTKCKCRVWKAFRRQERQMSCILESVSVISRRRWSKPHFHCMARLEMIPPDQSVSILQCFYSLPLSTIPNFHQWKTKKKNGSKWIESYHAAVMRHESHDFDLRCFDFYVSLQSKSVLERVSPPTDWLYGREVLNHLSNLCYDKC